MYRPYKLNLTGNILLMRYGYYILNLCKNNYIELFGLLMIRYSSLLLNTDHFLFIFIELSLLIVQSSYNCNL